MRKLRFVLLALALAAVLSACGGRGTDSRVVSSGGNSVSQLLEDAAQGTAAAETTPQPVLQSPVPLEAIDISSPDADVDLTLLSGTMVYSQVSQMMYSPDEFVGKTVKMNGAFSIFEGEERNYYACIVADAAACCANGIEFEWTGEHEYPDDYPEPGTDITVVGTFELYEEDGFLYSQLADAQVSF